MAYELTIPGARWLFGTGASVFNPHGNWATNWRNENIVQPGMEHTMLQAKHDEAVRQNDLGRMTMEALQNLPPEMLDAALRASSLTPLWQNADLAERYLGSRQQRELTDKESQFFAGRNAGPTAATAADVRAGKAAKAQKKESKRQSKAANLMALSNLAGSAWNAEQFNDIMRAMNVQPGGIPGAPSAPGGAPGAPGASPEADEAFRKALMTPKEPGVLVRAGRAATDILSEPLVQGYLNRMEAPPTASSRTGMPGPVEPGMTELIYGPQPATVPQTPVTPPEQRQRGAGTVFDVGGTAAPSLLQQPTAVPTRREQLTAGLDRMRGVAPTLGQMAQQQAPPPASMTPGLDALVSQAPQLGGMYQQPELAGMSLADLVQILSQPMQSVGPQLEPPPTLSKTISDLLLSLTAYQQ